MASRTKGAIVLCVMLCITVILGVLSVTGMALPPEGLYKLLPWVPTNAKQWPESISLGLDLQGGVYVEYQAAKPSDMDDGMYSYLVGSTMDVIRKRLTDKGFTEATVTQLGGDGIRVEGMRCYWSDSKLVFKYGDEDCDAIYDELHGIEESVPSTGSGTAGAFAVYPNPTNGVLFVETVCTPSLPDQTYRITNLVGQTVLLGNINADNQQINVSSLPQGMYFITFAGETRKFVVH